MLCSVPFKTSNNCTKVESAVDVLTSLDNAKDILSRWAPFAAKFEAPVALSRSDVSDSGVTISSVILNPIFALGNASL